MPVIFNSALLASKIVRTETQTLAHDEQRQLVTKDGPIKKPTASTSIRRSIDFRLDLGSVPVRARHHCFMMFG